ncbi:MAG TPA: CCA tRNA nucleotidyltransferase, partial [Phycisphaerae bacterium]|nr:CCA tRNA nucleotidyltransferase [Phycisphaerae bacterium]
MARPADKATATWVVRRLREAGFQALFAGGCVRDMLLGIRCNDYDVATDAVPDQVRALFGRVLLVGAKFGVAMVLHRGRKVEVTTFRSDLSYSDGRRPDGVRFSTPEEDARRRDFTINGMFYDPLDGRVIDFVGGRDDLRRRVLRTIGRADERFAEDYLRMLRAV